jgi:hypothetical protein
MRDHGPFRHKVSSPRPSARLRRAAGQAAGNPPSAKPLKTEISIQPRDLLYAAAPVALLFISVILFAKWGYTAPHGRLQMAWDGRLESAGRLRTLTMWFALFGLGTGCLIFCAIELRRFDARSRTLLKRIFFTWSAGLIAAAVFAPAAGRAEHVLGEKTICRALSRGPFAIGPTGPAMPTPENVSADLVDKGWEECRPSAQFRWLQALNLTQFVMLLLFLPAMLLGAVSCVAGLPEHRDQQVMRLKAFATLSAALLVTGLLFLSALLHWPAAALAEPSAKVFNAHVSAYLLYWGVTYSALIAAFYVPIGARLAGGLLGGSGMDLKPLDALKTAATIFAPVVTALLGDVLKF